MLIRICAFIITVMYVPHVYGKKNIQIPRNDYNSIPKYLNMPNIFNFND